MNIHLPAILMFTRGTRVLTHPHLGLWRIETKKLAAQGMAIAIENPRLRYVGRSWLVIARNSRQGRQGLCKLLKVLCVQKKTY